MALKFRLIDIPLLGGGDTKTAPFLVKPPHLTKLENCVMQKLGRYQSRSGSVALVANAVEPGGQLVTFDGELISDGPSNAGSGNIIGSTQWTLAKNAGEWVKKGQLQPCAVGYTGITGNLFDHQACDSATAGGITVYAYEERNLVGAQTSNKSAINGTIVDESTGAVIASNVSIAVGGTDPRVVAFGATSICVLYMNVAGSLDMVVVPVSAPAFGAPIALRLSTTYHVSSYEARYVAAASTPMIAVSYAYPNSGTWNIAAYGISVTGSIIVAAADMMTAFATPPTVHEFVLGAKVWIGAVPTLASSSISFLWTTVNLASPSSVYTLDSTTIGFGNLTAAVCQTPGGGVRFFYEEGGPQTATPLSPITIKCAAWAVGGTSAAYAPVYQMRGCGIVGDAFQATGDYPTPVIPVVFPSEAQPTYFVIDGGQAWALTAYSSLILAKMQPQNAGGLTSALNGPQSIGGQATAATVIPAPAPWAPGVLYQPGATITPDTPTGFYWYNYGTKAFISNPPTNATPGQPAGLENASPTVGTTVVHDPVGQSETGWKCLGYGGSLRWRVPTVTNVSGLVWAFAYLPIAPQTADYDGNFEVFRSVGRCSLDFSPIPTYAALGKNQHRVGGFLGAYDGAVFAEENFHLFPEVPDYLLGCPIGVIRTSMGLSGASGPGIGPSGNPQYEEANVFFPLPMSNSLGTKFGSGWQIPPGSYFTLWEAGGISPSGTAVAGSLVLTPAGGTSPQSTLTITSIALGQTFDLVFTNSGSGSPSGSLVQNSPGNWTITLEFGNTSPPANAFNINALLVNIIAGFNSNFTTSLGSGHSDGTLAPGTYTYTAPAGPSAPATPFVVWFTVDGVGTAPALGLTKSYCVPILSTDLDIDICNKVIGVLQYSTGSPVRASLGNVAVIGPNGTLASPGAPVSGGCALAFALGYAGENNGYGLPGCSGDTLGLLPIAGWSPIGYSSGSSSYFSSLMTIPAGNRLMAGGYFCIPVMVSSVLYTYVFYFTVDGIGAQPTDPVLAAGGSGNTQFFQISINSTDSAVSVTNSIWEAIATASSYGVTGQFYATPVPVIDGGSLTPGSATTPFLVIYYTGSGAPNGYQPAFNVTGSGWAFETTAQLGGLNPNMPSQPGSSATGNVAGCPPGGSSQAIWYFRITYEDYDAQGQLHRSQPSEPIPCIVNGCFMGSYNGHATGGCMPRFATYAGVSTLSTLRVTGKSNVSIVVYRTQKNEQAQNYYRSSGVLPSTSGLPVGPMINDPTSDDWVATGYTEGFYDVTDDNDIGTNPLLYTAAAAFNQAPPAPLCVLSRRNRLWTCDGESPYLARFSGAFVQGSGIAPAFNPKFTQPIPQGRGTLVAIGELDEKVVFLAQSGIYVMTGDGPDAFGNNSDFSTPDLISSEYGCLAATSLVQASDGLWFQSQKGICRLGRDLVVEYIGAPMEDYVQGNTVTSAVLMQDRNELRFGLSNGNIVVYQTLFGQWYVITGWSGTATIWNGAYTFLRADGTNIDQESSSATTDPDGAFTWIIEHPWFAFSGVQGYQRVARAEWLMDSATTAAFTITVSIDDNPAVLETYSVTPSGTPPKVKVYFANPRCQSMQLKLSSQGYIGLEALSLEVGGFSGLFRLPSGQVQ
jgi:hypothetical protein